MVQLSVVETVDVETGEIVSVEKAKSRSASWFKFMMKGGRKMAKMDLKVSDYKVLLWLFGSVKYGNRVSVNQLELSKDIGLTRETVNRSISTLEKFGVLDRVKRGNFGIEYRFNAEFVWCGNGRDNV